MDNRYYPAYQTTRSDQSQIHSFGYYIPGPFSPTGTAVYSNQQEQYSPRSIYNQNNLNAHVRENKHWWKPNGAFQPYRTTYQDYGPDKTLHYRKSTHLTQPFIHKQLNGILQPPASEPHKFDYHVPPGLNAAQQSYSFGHSRHT